VDIVGGEVGRVEELSQKWVTDGIVENEYHETIRVSI
jgi:hypothetical protein